MPKSIETTKKSASSKQVITQTNRLLKTSRFGRVYAWASVIILLSTTVLWAVLGARLQHSNADQLVDILLFKNASTFHQTTLPGAHSYLLKWPLFWLIGQISTSANSFMLATLAVVLATVASFTYVLYRINRRPLIFGTICLALASTLLLIPAQPYAGGLLPINMAMITTRNLEYIVYIISLVFLIKAPSIKSTKFWLAITGLTLLIASDKLFMSLSLGGAVLALLVYVFVKRWDLVTLAMNWLIASTVATVAATLVLWLISWSGLVHIASQAGAGPYSLLNSGTDLALGLIYAVMGLFTNFGANPAFDATVAKNIPHQAVSRLVSLSGPAFVVNCLLLLGGLYVVYKLIMPTLRQLPTRGRHAGLDVSGQLSLLLIWTTVAAFGVFIVSNHYYAVDARYLTIALFAVFVSVATFARGKQWPVSHIVLGGCVIAVGMLLGLTSVFRTYYDDSQALSQTNDRNSLVAQALERHPVSTLVGDYWRVIPTSLEDKDQDQKVTPLDSCSQNREALSSQAWQPNLNNHSFAYLLTLDGSLTDFPNCTLKQVITAYGRPNASTLIAGSYTHPGEQILFYDHGRNIKAPTTKQPAAGPSTVVPVSPDQLPYITCTGPTVMNFVAHQDDDLLFMNPDILHDIRAGDCIRSVYLTAGDAGQGKLYWLNRERGSEAAYASMLGLGNPIWVQRIVQLANNEFITVANPMGNSKISLLFMYLPDGGLKGDGFKATGFESLAKLQTGQIKQLQTVDGQSTYSATELVSALATLLHTFQPARINTQANYVSKVYPDHSDHLAVGNFVKDAYSKYEKDQYDDQVTIPIKFYIGYPVHGMAANISDGDLKAKEAAFFAYAQFDGGVCKTLQQCINTPTYNAYLTRQYQNSY